MKLQKAVWDDLVKICSVYADIIDKTADMDQYARWKAGIYPNDDIIKDYMKKNAMYVYMDQGRIAGVLAVTMEQSEDYHEIMWDVEAEDAQAAVIHILGINPEYQRRGIGGKMLDEVLELAKKAGKKVVRLDVLASNLPAQHMYQKKGFVYKGTRNQYAENTGWTDFYFYEYKL